MRSFPSRSQERRRPRHVAAALLVAALFAVVTVGASARILSKPANTSAPTISGTTQVGSTLTADPGVWGGSAPISYQYQWRRCGPAGGSCADIPGQNSTTYVLVSADLNNTLRVKVTASNTSGSSTAVSIPTAQISEPPTTTTAPTTTTTATTTTPSSSTGCPAGTGTVPVTEISPPARLQIDAFQATPAVIPATMSSFTLQVTVTDTCGQTVQGALVYATAVPFRQVTVPPEGETGPNGTVTLSFTRLSGFPATSRQESMVLYIRANKPGDNILAGITEGRLVSVPVHL